MKTPQCFDAVPRGSGWPRRRLLLSASAAVLAGPRAVLAQQTAADWPTKPVRVVTGWSPGGNADVLARLLADRMGLRSAYPFIVENRPGAAGTLGGQAVVHAEPDGHTLLVASMAEAMMVPPASFQTMQYDPAKDLQPVTLIGKWPLVLMVNAGFPAKTMTELVAYAKANRGKLNYGSTGTGTINHFTGELLNMAAGIDCVHVPYKGGAPMLADLVGGQIQLAFDSLGSGLPLIRGGKIRPLAVTGQQRLATIAEVPTTAEAGFPAVATDVWIGLFVPAKTPKAIAGRIHSAALLALGTAEARKALEDREMQPVGNSAEEFRIGLERETLKKREIAARIGLKPE